MIVSDSSCLIILDKLGKLELLKELYTKITIPIAVKNEVFRSKTKPDWIAHELGIRLTGVIGILLEAKGTGLIPDIKSFLDKMLKHDFRISQLVYDEALKLSEEN